MLCDISIVTQSSNITQSRHQNEWYYQPNMNERLISIGRLIITQRVQWPSPIMPCLISKASPPNTCRWSYYRKSNSNYLHRHRLHLIHVLCTTQIQEHEPKHDTHSRTNVRCFQWDGEKNFSDLCKFVGIYKRKWRSKVYQRMRAVNSRKYPIRRSGCYVQWLVWGMSCR